jgi:anaerobic nitric oxide reductase transcription regulator
VDAGRFRADLFHRINVYPVTVPPLRHRKTDIPMLAGYFCERTQRRLGLGPVRIGPDTHEALSGYEWPGNVRELENIISRAVLKASAGLPRGRPVMIRPSHLGSDLSADNSAPPPQARQSATQFSKGFSLQAETRNFQRRTIRLALEKNNGNWAAAARDLGMHRSNLHHLATRLGLRA